MMNYYSTIIVDNSPNELKHYGVAHNQNPPGRGSGRYPYGSKKDRIANLNRRRELSDEDLDMYIKRLEKEGRFRQLSEKDVKENKTKIEDIVERVSDKVITATLTASAFYVIGSIMAKKGNKELGDMVKRLGKSK